MERRIEVGSDRPWSTIRWLANVFEDSMKHRFRRGTLYTVRADATGQHVEESRVFNSLDELYDACMSPRPREMINRVTLNGVDDEGDERDITFVFQSRTAR